MVRNYRNLKDFINHLDKEDELLKIDTPVSTDLEISHITELMSKSREGGKALLFENVIGHKFPVLTNAFGSKKRICMALGIPDIEILVERIKRFFEMKPPGSIKDLTSAVSIGFEIFRAIPRQKRYAPCQEVVYKYDEVDLSILPVLKCWPKDAGHFITLPAVITKSLKTGRRNMGMYRMQVYGRNTTGMHWHIHKDGAHYFSEYREAGKRMPVAVVIGADPATIYAATAPLPRGIDEIVFSGFIRKKPVPLTKCITIDLEVPAEADIILEGYIDPEELHLEGPFGDHTGYYSLADKYPVFHVTAITHRKNPIYAATVVGRPPMEDCYIAWATERIFLPMLKIILPEIKDYWMPWEGVFHNIVIVAIKKEYPGHARKVMSALWGQGQMGFTKIIVVVDCDISLENRRGLFQNIIDEVDIDRDLYITEGILDVLDHSAPQPLFGGKLGIDATRKKSASKKESSVSVYSHTDLKKKLRKISPNFSELYIPDIKSTNRIILVNFIKDGNISIRHLSDTILNSSLMSTFSIMVVYDEDVHLKDTSYLLWKAFNNVDPVRDIYRKRGKIIIDATKKGEEDGHKREWPEEISMDPKIARKVQRIIDYINL